MKSVLQYLDENVETYLSAIFLTIFSILTIIQVVMRYIFDNPLAWSEELSRYAFIWFVYMSASYAVKYKRHVRFGFFVNMLPKTAKLIVQLIALLCWLGFLIFLDIYSYQVMSHLYSSMQTSPANKIPMFLVYLSVPIGSLLMTVRVLQHIWKSFTGYSKQTNSSIQGEV